MAGVLSISSPRDIVRFVFNLVWHQGQQALHSFLSLLFFNGSLHSILRKEMDNLLKPISHLQLGMLAPSVLTGCSKMLFVELSSLPVNFTDAMTNAASSGLP